MIWPQPPKPAEQYVSFSSVRKKLGKNEQGFHPKATKLRQITLLKLTTVSKTLLYITIYILFHGRCLYCGMFKRGLFLTFLTISAFYTHAQQSDFCEAVTTIINDAPEKFRNIRGKTTTANARVGTWECGVKVPGTIASRFVLSGGLFYEGALFQSKSTAGLKDAYDKFKGQLADCLKPMGYAVSYQENFTPGLKDFRKVVYMREVAADASAHTLPAHVTVEVTYNKQVGLYTLVMFIFEH